MKKSDRKKRGDKKNFKKSEEPAWIDPEKSRKTPWTDEEIERFVEGFLSGHPIHWEHLVKDDGPNTARIILRNRFKARDNLRNQKDK